MQCPSCRASVDDARFCPACGAALTGATAEAPARDPLIGQVLGAKYAVVRLLGEGGMGAVYEGEQQLGAAKRRVAVKTLHPHLSRDPKIKARFEREVATIAELEHPNTIQVHDFGSTADGILYIVMEFLHGRSLADLIEREGALPPERTRAILEQICGSLEEAHGHGIVHRDLKPDNVVLVERAGKKDFVKVLDFGIAKRSREEDREEQKLTQQGMVLGTPPYMSPEQFTGQPIDARSDIYSLGVMTYEMLTGKLPFKADTAWEWATQHMSQPPIPIESLAEGARASEAMRASLRRALAKAPGERFQSAREFFTAFSGVGASPYGATAAVAVDAQGASPWQKTALAAPIDAGAALGAPSPGGPAPSGPTHAFTPVAGNVSFPTPVGIPQPPPRAAAGGAGRGKLLAAAGIIGIASVAAIAFAMKGPGSRSAGKEVVLGDDHEIAPAPATSLSAGSVGPVDLAVAADAASTGDIPPLRAAAAARPQPQAHAATPAPGPAAGPQPQARPISTPEPAPEMPRPPPAQQQQEPSMPSRYDGIECARARMFRRMGRRREAERWAAACFERGGDPD